MTDRIRIMVFGGDPGRWVRRGMEQVLDWEKVSAHSVEAIFILGRFSSRFVKTEAENAAPPSVPRITVMSPHHIVAELKKNPRWKSRIELLEQESTQGRAVAIRQEQEPATGTGTHEEKSPQAPAQPETAMGVSLDELWDIYKPQIIESVRSVFKEGEKMREPDFLPVVAEAVGMKPEELRQLLPKLAVRGILDHTGNDTWKLLPRVGVEYRYEHDAEPLPIDDPRQKPESRINELAALVAGLPEGPYPSRYAIETELMRRGNFTNKEGKRIPRVQASRVVARAIDRGFVIKDEEEWRVVHDESVALAQPDGHAAPPRPKSKAATPADAPAEAKKPAPEKPLKISDDVHFLKGAVGAAALSDETRELIYHARALVAQRHWDECAKNSVMKRLRIAGVSPVPLPKEAFTEDEWAALAWETVKAFSFEVVVPILHREFVDEKIGCSSCGSEFVFEKGEAEFFFNKGLAKPKRCQRCRSDAQDSDRLARRFGG